MIIRTLTKDDIILYRNIRLELLKNHPENFGSSFEDEEKFADSMWLTRLDKETVSTFGAFIDDAMAGLCVMVNSPREKMKHISSLHSMYVVPMYRSKGVAKALISHVVKTAKQDKRKRLNLSVVSTNKQAYNLYKNLGFLEYGLEPETIFYNGKYYDLVLMSKEL